MLLCRQDSLSHTLSIMGSSTELQGTLSRLLQLVRGQRQLSHYYFFRDSFPTHHRHQGAREGRSSLPCPHHHILVEGLGPDLPCLLFTCTPVNTVSYSVLPRRIALPTFPSTEAGNGEGQLSHSPHMIHHCWGTRDVPKKPPVMMHSARRFLLYQMNVGFQTPVQNDDDPEWYV